MNKEPITKKTNKLKPLEITLYVLTIIPMAWIAYYQYDLFKKKSLEYEKYKKIGSEYIQALDKGTILEFNDKIKTRFPEIILSYSASTQGDANLQKNNQQQLAELRIKNIEDQISTLNSNVIPWWLSSLLIPAILFLLSKIFGPILDHTGEKILSLFLKKQSKRKSGVK